MTIPKDIPEKWFPIIIPLKRKKEGLSSSTKIRKRAGTFTLEIFVQFLTLHFPHDDLFVFLKCLKVYTNKHSYV